MRVKHAPDTHVVLYEGNLFIFFMIRFFIAKYTTGIFYFRDSKLEKSIIQKRRKIKKTHLKFF